MIPVLKIEPKALIDSIMAGLGAMAKNDGSALNRDVFWKAAAKVSGVDLIKYEDMFTDYYNNEFVAAKTQPSLILMQKNVLILQKKTDTK